MKIGLPRAMHFYSYGVLWYTFLEKLDAEVVLSDLTSKQTLDGGTKKMVDGACLPLKILRGHVEDLKTKQVDAIFLPRIVKLSQDTFACPKSAGLPELIYQTGRDLPRLLSPAIEGDITDAAPYYETGRQLGCSKKKVQRALQIALQKWQHQQQRPVPSKEQPGQKTIVILGHPYLTEDRFVNFDLKRKLTEQGYRVITSCKQRRLADTSSIYPHFMFWQSGHDMAWMLDELGRTDGCILLSAFGCGPDSYIESYCREEMRRQGVPYLALTLDEQTGEAGFGTRVEAFLDVLERREGRQGA